ncbi:hypothetical protein ACOSP7_013106 [Xanthoceras sorbifolium]
MLILLLIRKKIITIIMLEEEVVIKVQVKVSIEELKEMEDKIVEERRAEVEEEGTTIIIPDLLAKSAIDMVIEHSSAIIGMINASNLNIILKLQVLLLLEIKHLWLTWLLLQIP